MKKKLPITKNKDVVVSWVYTWSKQQDMSIHEQRIVLRILEACQAELKGVKLKIMQARNASLSMDFGMLMHKCMYLTLFFPDVITMKS